MNEIDPKCDIPQFHLTEKLCENGTIDDLLKVITIPKLSLNTLITACYKYDRNDFLTEIKRLNESLPIENKFYGFMIYECLSRKDFDTFNWIKSKINNFEVDGITVERLIEQNHIDILIWLIDQAYLKCNADIVSVICGEGQVGLLQILHERGLLTKYDEYALLCASEMKHKDVLNWWSNSGLELKYDTKIIKHLLVHDNIDMLNWWSKSGLVMKIDNFTHNYVHKKSSPEVQQWWLENKDRGHISDE